jgi:hypothetical protein
MSIRLPIEDRRESPPRAGRVRPTLAAFAGCLALLLQVPRPAPGSEARHSEWRIRFEETAFASGDLVFRRGRSLISRAVLAVDGGSEYSHVGLISVIGGRVLVIHAVPADPPHSSGGVIAEPLSMFLSPDKATAVGLYRPRDASLGAVAERAAWQFERAHIPFDSAFDLATPNELYCTEMVWRAYRKAGIDLAPADPSHPEKYLLPSRLLRSPDLRKIQAFQEGTRP